MNNFRKYFLVIGALVTFITFLRGTLNAHSVSLSKSDHYSEYLSANTVPSISTDIASAISTETPTPTTQDSPGADPDTSPEPTATDSKESASVDVATQFIDTDTADDSAASQGTNDPSSQSVSPQGHSELSSTFEPDEAPAETSAPPDRKTDALSPPPDQTRGSTSNSRRSAHPSSSTSARRNLGRSGSHRSAPPTTAVGSSQSSSTDGAADESLKQEARQSFEKMKQAWDDDVTTKPVAEGKPLQSPSREAGGHRGRSRRSERTDNRESTKEEDKPSTELQEEKELLASFHRINDAINTSPTAAEVSASASSGGSESRDARGRSASRTGRRAGAGASRGSARGGRARGSAASPSEPAEAASGEQAELSLKDVVLPADLANPQPEPQDAEPVPEPESVSDPATETPPAEAQQPPAQQKAGEKAEDSSGDEEAEEEEVHEGYEVQDINDPEIQAIMKKRKKHNGPYFRLVWPLLKKSQENDKPVHLRLHLRQFFEDGSFGVRYGTGEKTTHRGLHPHLDYITENQNGKQLTRYTYNAAMLPFLPREDALFNYSSCAVVSNSGELLRNKFGDEIDSHSAVFRINYPPIEGYEQHVGTKSTYEVTNMHHIQLIADAEHPQIPRGTKTFRAPQGKPTGGTASLVLWESTDLVTKWRYNTIPKLLQRHPPPHTMILSPDLVNTAETMFARLEESVARPGEACRAMNRRQTAGQHNGGQISAKQSSQQLGCKPTSGWFALAFASQICSEVHMYGFSKWRKHSNEQQAPYHYFDSVNGTTNVHSFDLSYRMYEELASHYPVILH